MPVAPDANGTLRVSFGHVMGYTPHDAVVMMPQTRLAGMLEKVTGPEPFAVPETVRAAAAQVAKTPWIDPRLHPPPRRSPLRSPTIRPSSDLPRGCRSRRNSTWDR